MSTRHSLFTYLILLFGLWAGAALSLFTLAFCFAHDPILHALTGMAGGLGYIWIVCGGLLMWRFREPIRTQVQRIRLDWRLKFVLFCTLLALLEEAITTGMTNLAPMFGVKPGQAYITASANYLDVIALHGVSLFVSFFVGWAVLLWRYAFSPFAVFVLFGITGTLVEMLFGGPAHLFEYAMWTYVYGLMVWLPACCIPTDRRAHPPHWWHYPLAVFTPFLFVFLFPLLGVISLFFPHHPRIHFPPIR